MSDQPSCSYYQVSKRQKYDKETMQVEEYVMTHLIDDKCADLYRNRRFNKPKYFYSHSQKEEMSESEKRRNAMEKLTCKWFAKYGIPYEAANDELFKKMLHNLDEFYKPPTSSSIETRVRTVAVTIKTNRRDLENTTQPIFVTVNPIEYENFVYLAFSLHYILDNGIRKTSHT
ncbi:unnamed protein product [Caenorhabditis angaria]|uniref:Uncharacterized protein n=1 Tax=Caenorhabditis angaria TaxID=860376 RepID=A0A9P1I1Y0_9PELO|nr:unnamed protein product [Caenorhabditis angaria]